MASIRAGTTGLKKAAKPVSKAEEPDLLSQIAAGRALKHHSAAPAPAPKDDPNDLLAAIRNAKKTSTLKHVDSQDPHPHQRTATEDTNTLATALAHLRTNVASESDSDDDEEISDDEWD
jgi:hypothetical protein